MAKVAEGVGKSFDEAVLDALNKVGLKKEQVSVEIIEEPKKRIFSILDPKQVKVRITEIEQVPEKTEDGRVRGKGEMAMFKGLSKVGEGCGYVVGGYTALFVGALTTPISLPRLACCGIKSAINKNYNKRIEKARGRVKEIESELKTLDAQNMEAQPEA